MSSALPSPQASNYKGNSKIDREIAAEAKAEPKLKKIEGMNVVTTKKSIGKRVKESFGGQDLRSVGLYLLFDVIVPSSRDLLFDLIKEGGHRAIYGDSSRRSTSSEPTRIVGSSRIRSTNYNTMSATSTNGRTAGDTALSSRERTMFDFSNLVIPERDIAEMIVERMTDAVEEFGTVSVADFYDLLEITGTGFTDQTFGWTAATFRNVSARKVRDGFIIDLPTPTQLA